MGKIKPSWYYKRQATEAEARETYFRTKPPPPVGTTVQQKDVTDCYYRSVFKKQGSDNLIYTVGVDADALAAVPVATSGLLLVLPTNSISSPIRGSGVKPCRASWYQGKATPTIGTTKWGTKWVQNYDKKGTGAAARSHYSTPISLPTGIITVEALIAKFNSIFKQADGKPNTTLLGTKNGRANFEMEKISFSAQS